jgi:hypothetical protein
MDNQTPAQSMTPEAAAEYLEQAKTDSQLRNEILANRLSNPALAKWNRAQEIVHANPLKAPAAPPPPAPNTPEFVRAEINRSLADPAFIARPDAHQKLDEMLEREKALTPVAPIVEPGLPQDAAAYLYHAPLRDSPEAQADDQVLRIAALSAGLTTGDFRAVSEASATEAVDLTGKSEAEKEAIVDAFYTNMHRMLGPNYDQYMDAGVRLIKEIEVAQPGTLKTIERLGLQYSPTLALMLCQKGMLRYRGRQ